MSFSVIIIIFSVKISESKIEKYNSNKEAQYYNFYDNYHTYARLTVEVIDKGEKVHVDVMPF